MLEHKNSQHVSVTKRSSGKQILFAEEKIIVLTNESLHVRIHFRVKSK